MLKFPFWRPFDREPSYKERARFAEKTRDELIDALVAGEEALIKHTEDSTKRYDDMVKDFQDKITETARLTKIAVEDQDRKHNQKVADLTRENKQALEDAEAENAATVAQLENDHALEVARITAEGEIAAERAELAGEFSADKKIKEAKEGQVLAEKQAAVVTAENAIYKDLIDVSGDLGEIKGLTEKIIDKLPTINLTSLPSAAPAPKQEKKDKDN